MATDISQEHASFNLDLQGMVPVTEKAKYLEKAAALSKL